jgi:hypothetical protein
MYLAALLDEVRALNATQAAVQAQLLSLTATLTAIQAQLLPPEPAPGDTVDLREPIAESSTNPPPSPRRRLRRS